MNRVRSFAAVAVLSVALSACSGMTGGKKLGESAEVPIFGQNLKTSKAEMVITKVDQPDPSELEGLKAAQEYGKGQIYFVHYTAKKILLEGDNDPANLSSAYSWSGEADSGKVTTINVVTGEPANCQRFDIKKFTAGQVATGCQILVTEKANALTKVVYKDKYSWKVK